jgi:hypothetical protein
VRFDRSGESGCDIALLARFVETLFLTLLVVLPATLGALVVVEVFAVRVVVGVFVARVVVGVFVALVVELPDFVFSCALVFLLTLSRCFLAILRREVCLGSMPGRTFFFVAAVAVDALAAPFLTMAWALTFFSSVNLMSAALTEILWFVISGEGIKLVTIICGVPVSPEYSTSIPLYSVYTVWSV